MFFQKILLACAIAVLCANLSAAQPAAASGTAAASASVVQKKFRVFVLSQSMGYKHASVTRSGSSLSVAEKAIIEIGERSGAFTTECSQDATQLTAAKLKEIDALVFFTSGNLPLKPAEFSEIQKWLREGKAFIGVHSATDTFKEFKPYNEILGAIFLKHPWNKGGVIENLEPTHSAVKMFPAEFAWGDELCDHQYFEARKSRVLLALNVEKSSPKSSHCVPLCWVREYGKGRVFYTNFGNSEAVWGDELFRRHLLGGLKWAMKLEPGSAEPNQDVESALDTRARLAMFESEKSWLAKAARSVRTEPNVVIASMEKMAKIDAAGFAKVQSLVAEVRTEEKAKEAMLGLKRKPSEKEMNAVLSRRMEVMRALVPPVEK